MDEERGFRRFLSETKDKAKDIADQVHISAEARNIIKDFIEIANQTERLLNARSEAGGDMRVLTKRFEVLKQENRQMQNRIDKIKEIIGSELAPILKAMTTDAVAIGEKGQQLGDAALQEISTRSKASIKKFVEVLTKL